MVVEILVIREAYAVFCYLNEFCCQLCVCYSICTMLDARKTLRVRSTTQPKIINATNAQKSMYCNMQRITTE